ncbi:LysM peptidoglycan-binding domain-containing protein [Aureimonas glaciei]|uniref:LysM domain-containing protein n=1 Tax=Aureimonas glaciei TaxID=1776957 RepID=A0A916XVC8_9HYPH|nr:LysM domain-containing protein [Aureimonas glaciei]GGD15564.1 hypothetical protein GCM10011335_18000 [Aureimonas glaciei]
MTKFLSLLAIALATTTSLAQAQDTAPACQDGVVVERGDTLSAIAERCDLSEARLLAANRGVEGSSDLVIGQKLATETTGEQVGSRLWGQFKGAVGETGNTLEGVAEGVQSSAQGILDRNPDLRSGIDSLRSRLDVTGSSGRLAVTPLPATPEADVEIAATALPADQAVRINVGVAGAASETVAEGRTSAEGSLTQTTKLPAWLPEGKQVVVTITDAEQNVLARSARFDPS